MADTKKRYMPLRSTMGMVLVRVACSKPTGLDGTSLSTVKDRSKLKSPFFCRGHRSETPVKVRPSSWMMPAVTRIELGLTAERAPTDFPVADGSEAIAGGAGIEPNMLARRFPKVLSTVSSVGTPGARKVKIKLQV